MNRTGHRGCSYERRCAYTRPWARFLVEPVEAVSFVMSEKMLRGIRDRAEQVA
jgi:hypothetical protein